MTRLRVGVLFGGRSGEHEVSLASAASVIAALERGGHAVVPLGIARDGRWVVGGDPLRALAAEARLGLPSADPADAVKKALTSRVSVRAEATPGAEPGPSTTDNAADTALARREASAGLPAEVRRAVDVMVVMLH